MTKREQEKDCPDAPRSVQERDALFCISLFVHRHLRTIYGTLNLDLVALLLLDEIARHNLQPLNKGGLPTCPRGTIPRNLMRGCNAFSLSQATGIPRETVRRKIKQLEEIGWIEKENSKGYFVTMRAMDRLSSEEFASLLDDFRDTARQVEEILKK